MAIKTFKRKEIKFLLDINQFNELLNTIDLYMNPDEYCVGGKEYGIFNYTGHIGGAHYFYIKPGTYTIKSLSATNGNYIYLEYGNVRQPLSAGRTFTVPASFFSIVFSKKAL